MSISYTFIRLMFLSKVNRPGVIDYILSSIIGGDQAGCSALLFLILPRSLWTSSMYCTQKLPCMPSSKKSQQHRQAEHIHWLPVSSLCDNHFQQRNNLIGQLRTHKTRSISIVLFVSPCAEERTVCSSRLNQVIIKYYTRLSFVFW